jgi:hypothetical protein
VDKKEKFHAITMPTHVIPGNAFDRGGGIALGVSDEVSDRTGEARALAPW